MRFSFYVKLTDKDYLLFNEFVSKNSEMGKKNSQNCQNNIYGSLHILRSNLSYK